MNLIGARIGHITLGQGEVISQNGNYFRVRFSTKETNFVYPDAFERYVSCSDEGIQAQAMADLAAKRECERIETERRLAEEQARREAQMERESRERRPRRSAAATRYAGENNLAFKCNYCNGGASGECIGYKCVCSDEHIRYNIEKANRTWCSKESSPCSRYLRGEIDRGELERLNGERLVCYEARMLVDWRADAGEDINSGNARARRITNAASDSLAILTTTLPGSKERYIFAAFITEMVDVGDERSAGYVKANAEYKIELTPTEARQMRFWHYYRNKKDDKKQWGQHLYRYISDETAARVLLDIVNIKEGAEKENALRVLRHYCRLKGLDINSIPPASGVI